jgi:hypothetical protein
MILGFLNCTYITKVFIEIPPCAKKVIFITEFVFLDLYPHFYEVNQGSEKGLGISNIFFLDHFSPSFLGQKC